MEATLRLVAIHGVQGTTLHRIANELGITHSALYAHFENRREILLTALDVIFSRILAVHKAFTDEDALERVMAISRYHSTLAASPSEGFVAPLFEFIAASPAEGLREELAVRERVLLEDLAGIVRMGQQQGSIRPDVDPVQAAWLLTSRLWAEDVAALMGVGEEWSRASSIPLLELILTSIRMPESARE